jgi:predicted MFS family arabinose efflux permease
MLSGVAMIAVMPLMGKLSDKVSKFKLFTAATLVAVVLNITYSNYGATAFWLVAVTHVCMMSAVMSRMTPAMALASAVPQAHDRGAYMSINSSLQQIAGGFGAMLAGAIIVQKDHYAPLEHFDTLAYIASAIMLFTICLVYRVSQMVEKKG